MNRRIQEYYDRIQPSDELLKNTLKRIHKSMQKKHTVRYIIECGVSLAACFLISLLFNRLNLSAVSPGQSPSVASVFSNASGYIIGGCIFAILVIMLTVVYLKTKNKR